MKELLARPGFLAPSGTVGADVSYLLALVFTLMFLISWGMAKKGLGTQHHKLIFVSMVSMVVYFCAYYYARQLGVLSFEGKEGFGGPQEVYDNIFVPILTTHLILVTLGLILSIYMICQGFRSCSRTSGEYHLRTGELKVNAEAFKKILFALVGLWAVNQIILIFVRHKSFAASLAWVFIFGTAVLVVYLERVIEKLLPDGARRHRQQ